MIEYNIQINYKSGITVYTWTDKFEMERTHIGRTVEWGNMTPRPMLIGVDDIESVWVVGKREKEDV